MKCISIILLLLGVAAAAPVQAAALPADSLSFYEAIQKIERAHRIKFAFDHQLFAPKKVAPFNAQDDIEDILSRLIDFRKFTYELSGNTVLLTPRTDRVLLNVSLSGLILDENTGEPLPNAAIYLSGSGKYAISNRDGRFQLLNVPADTSQLDVRYLGYAPRQFCIKDLPTRKHVKIGLSDSPEVLDEVTIAGKKEEVFAISEQSSKISVDVDEFKSMANFGEPDVFRSLQLLPGVSASNETSAGMVIRGGAPEQNLVLLDGFTIYHMDHFFGVFSALNTNTIKDVQLYKGAYDPRYGNRVSGVLDITAKTGNTNKPTVSLSMNMISSSLVAEIPITKRLSLLAAGRRSYTDVIRSTLYRKLFSHVKDNEPATISHVIDKPDEFSNSDFYFFDLNSKLTYRFDENNLMSLSFYTGRDRLRLNMFDAETTIGEGSRVFYHYEEAGEWGNKGLSFRYARQWNKKFFTELMVSGSGFLNETNYTIKYEIEVINEQGLKKGADHLSPYHHNDVAETSLKLDAEYRFSDAHILSFGLFSIANDIASAHTYSGGSRHLKHYADQKKGSTNGSYTQYSYRPEDKLHLNVGLRLSVPPGVDRSIYLEPRVSLSYKPKPKLNLKAAYGRHQQFLVNTAITDKTITGQRSFWQLSNGESVPMLSSDHYTAGVSYAGHGYTIDIEVFTRGISGVSTLSRNDPDQLAIITGTQRVNGVEFLVKKTANRYKGWLAYTYSKSQQSFADINGGRAFPSNQDQRHEVKWVNRMTLGRWDFSAAWIYGSGKPYTPVLVSGNAASRNSRRLPAYHRLDASAAYHTNIGSTKASFGVNLLNLCDRSNIKGYRMINLPDNNQVFTQKAVKLLDFTPSAFINFTF